MSNFSVEQIQEVLDFLNSIEGDGYGCMASFEIARMNVRDMLSDISGAQIAAGGQDEINALVRLIWYGWDDEHVDDHTLDEINCAARKLYALGYRKLDPMLLKQWADDFEAAAHEVPKGIKSTILMTRAQEVRRFALLKNET